MNERILATPAEVNLGINWLQKRGIKGSDEIDTSAWTRWLSCESRDIVRELFKLLAENEVVPLSRELPQIVWALKMDKGRNATK